MFMMRCAPEMVRPTQQPWEAVVPVVSTCSPQRYNPKLKMGQGGAPCWLHCYAVSYVEAVQSYTATLFKRNSRHLQSNPVIESERGFGSGK
jgi:hypothetical protein